MMLLHAGDSSVLPRAAVSVGLFLWACGDGATPSTRIDGSVIPDAATLNLQNVEPGAAFELSTGNTDGQDEDPSIALRHDRLLVAWYSNRGGVIDGREDKEIYVTATQDGRTWSAPVAATSSAEWAFYPDIAVLGDNSVALAWWQVRHIPPGCTPGVNCTGGTNNGILFATSTDGNTWNTTAMPESLGGGPGDWLPCLVPSPTTTDLWLYFAAVARNADGSTNPGETRNHIYMRQRTGGVWSAAVRLTGIDDGTTHNSYPDVVRRGDGSFVMTWTRFDGPPYSNPLTVINAATSETWVATSTDGVNFNGLRNISDAGPGDETDAFPHVFTDHVGAHHVTWISTAVSPQGGQVELPLQGIYPTDRRLRPELAGYTASMVAVPNPGVLFGAYVTGAAPKQKVMGRFFRR